MAKKRIFSLILITCLLVSMAAIPSCAVGDIIAITGAAAQAAGAAGAATIGGMTVSANIDGDEAWQDSKRQQAQTYVRTLLADGSHEWQNVHFDMREGTIYFKPEDINLSLAVIQEMAMENNFVAPPELQKSGWEYWHFPDSYSYSNSTVNIIKSAGFPVAVSPTTSWWNVFSPQTFATNAVQLDSVNFPDGCTIAVSLPEFSDSSVKPRFVYGLKESTDPVLYIDAYGSSNTGGTYNRLASLHWGESWSLPITAETRNLFLRFTLRVCEIGGYQLNVQAGALYSIGRPAPVLGGTAPGVFSSDVKLILPSPEQIEERYQNEEAEAIAFTPMKSDGTPLLAGIDNGEEVSAVLMDAYINGLIASSEITDGVLPEDDNSVLGSILSVLTDVRNKVRTLPQDIFSLFAGALSAIGAKVEALVERLTPPPPDWDGLFAPFSEHISNFNFSSIWHYVTAWVGSLAAGAGVIFSVFGMLPYGMVVPIYATAVIVIIVGIYKRYIV